MVFLNKSTKSLKALRKEKEMKKKKRKKKKNRMGNLIESAAKDELGSGHSVPSTPSGVNCFQMTRPDKLLENMLRKKKRKQNLEKVPLLLESINGKHEEEEEEEEKHSQPHTNGWSKTTMGVGDQVTQSKKGKKKKMKQKMKKLQAQEESTPLLSEDVENNEKDVVKQNGSPASPRKGNTTKPMTNGVSHPAPPELPIAECREMFIKNVIENDTLIVVGETGSGKSTQIPQYLIQDCAHLFSFKGMAITQPRRVAAISLATRVSYELNTNVGELVGYKVRFEKEISDKTKITFLTDGFLMMDAIRDNLFREYSVIIVDEAHERSVETDVVLSLLRSAQRARSKLSPKKRLKLIVMSATLDIDKFKSFFDTNDTELKTKAVYIKGRPYNLEINYLPKLDNICDSHVDLVWITLLKLHLQLPVDHHILVFLTGKEEIDLLVSRATSINQQNNLHRVYVCPLYAALPKEVQLKSFELPTKETRKIVVSTNIAETSLTIPGIRVVIDSGRVKSKYFDQSLGMDVLRVQLTSKSQADQRAGRAGREFEGSVYRLYTKNIYDQMEQFPPPEITRSNLSRILLLAAVSLGIENFSNFPLPDKPPQRAIQYAMNELHQFGAIQSTQLPIKLTRTARRLLSFPVELHLARVLYLAVQYQELSRICAIVAILTVESIYMNNSSSMDEDRYSQKNKYQTLWAPEGDFLTFWKIFKDYKKSKNKKSWCKEHGIQFRTMLYVTQVWRHLLTLCQNMELEDDEMLSSGDAVQFSEKLHLIFKTAFSHQKARLSATGNFYIVENIFDPSVKFHAKIHPSSSLIQRKPARIIFTHLSFNETDNAVYMHNCGVL